MKNSTFSVLALVILYVGIHVVASYCGKNSCCTTSSCKACTNNCYSQCPTSSCTNNCIENCAQSIPQNCQGNNCNTCTESRCCSGQYCNSCASSCHKRCSTSACKNNCINKCIDTTPSCDSNNCTLCVGGKCCNNSTCNDCVTDCYAQTSGCTKTCIKQCIQPEPIKIELPLPANPCINEDKSEIIVINSTDKRSEAVNITTIINLKNIINNTNIISSPVYVNNTNVNHIHFPKLTGLPNKTISLETLNNHTHNTNLPDGCCYVLHPRECFYVQKGETSERQIKCVRRRHRECSPLCTSSVILLTPLPYPYPVPHYVPSNPQPQQCHYIQQYPWVYCGNYQKHDCGTCYRCEHGNGPQACAYQHRCPLVCRSNLFL